jgi:RNA polymerase sigma-70 factor (ECF subfamily)
MDRTSMDDKSGNVTQLLRALNGGELQASDRLFSLLYSELRRLAAFHMGGERGDHTLTPTALVHEAWLRLSGNENIHDRHHFFALAAQAMRRVLVDHARARQALCRGGSASTISIDSKDIPQPLPPTVMISLDEALNRLAIMKPRAAQVIELRFFAGLTEEQVATILNVTRRTVNRDWEMARAWLFNELAETKG